MKLLFENLQTFMPEQGGAGAWDIPIVEPTEQEIDPGECISFNYARSCPDGKDKTVHFFLDDAQFLRVWNTPDRYISVLRRFRYVCAPDFSLYTDMPKALQLYNHYRKHWCAAYWQYLGLNVIPTISWSDKESFEWCFDGEPVGSVVAIGTTGTQQSKATRRAFLDGYEKMLDRLSPVQILVYGEIPTDLKGGNIVQIGNYSARFGNRGRENGR